MAITLSYNQLIKPVAAGMAVAAVDYAITDRTITAFVNRFIRSPDFDTPTFKQDPTESNTFYKVAIKWPIIEEIICRFVIHSSISWALKKILPEKEISPGICSIKVAQLAASLTSGILFGALHWRELPTLREKIIQSTGASVSGILYGILKEKYGLLAPISAHMTHNTLSCAFEYLATRKQG